MLGCSSAFPTGTGHPFLGPRHSPVLQDVQAAQSRDGCNALHNTIEGNFNFIQTTLIDARQCFLESGMGGCPYWQTGAGVPSTGGSSAQVVAGACVPLKQKESGETSNSPKRVLES